MYHFCTYFDSNYLIKGLALYRSLVRHARPFCLWVLCFDDVVYNTLQKLSLPEIFPIPLSDFEAQNQDFRNVKTTRSRIEYYFTSTPVLPMHILQNWPEVDLITYLDADLFFFSDPAPIYKELKQGSVLIVGHRFPQRLKYLESRGIYNVGLLSFRRDSRGSECLHWWRKKCVEWCYDRIENGRYADQKYLNDWLTRFPGVVELQHAGAGLAPWNVENYTFHIGRDGHVLIDSDPLVFFHFHGLKKISNFLIDPGLRGYVRRADEVLKQGVYLPYIREIRNTNRWLSRHIASKAIDMAPIRAPSSDSLRQRLKPVVMVAKKVLNDDVWIVSKDRIFSFQSP